MPRESLQRSTMCRERASVAGYNSGTLSDAEGDISAIRLGAVIL
jgi:hypothetical protein